MESGGADGSCLLISVGILMIAGVLLGWNPLFDWNPFAKAVHLLNVLFGGCGVL